MTSKEEFIKYLVNLKKSNKTSVTVDVDFLLNMINAAPSTQHNPTKPATKNIIQVELDGGEF